jgi:hypothetical protein
MAAHSDDERLKSVSSMEPTPHIWCQKVNPTKNSVHASRPQNQQMRQTLLEIGRILGIPLSKQVPSERAFTL